MERKLITELDEVVHAAVVACALMKTALIRARANGLLLEKGYTMQQDGYMDNAGEALESAQCVAEYVSKLVLGELK